LVRRVSKQPAPEAHNNYFPFAESVFIKDHIPLLDLDPTRRLQSDLLAYRRMDPDLTPLRRLWPNREHESNWLKGLLCAIGFHRWHTLMIGAPASAIDFCRWCPDIRRHPGPQHRRNTINSPNR
jgi:hypothetical protein